MDEITPESITKGLDTQFVGRRVVAYYSVTSTNDVAKQLAAQGAPEGTLVLAEEQTVGRGRHGRRWIAPAGSSLLVSIILRPSLGPSDLSLLLMASALATAQAIEESTGLPVAFKWPNDVLLRGKKAGGILMETGLSGEEIDYVVVGVGLNVDLDVAQIPEIAATATSVCLELGKEVSRLNMLRSLLTSVENEYLLLQRGESPLKRWSARLAHLGQQVEVETPWGRECGLLESVDSDGSLILERSDGTKARITVGDVT